MASMTSSPPAAPARSPTALDQAVGDGDPAAVELRRSPSIVATQRALAIDEVGGHRISTSSARLATIAARSSTVVSGLTMHQRRTVSPPHAVGVTNDCWLASCQSLHAW